MSYTDDDYLVEEKQSAKTSGDGTKCFGSINQRLLKEDHGSLPTESDSMLKSEMMSEH